MDQREKRAFLLDALLREEPRYRDLRVPGDEAGQRRLLRSLMNVRPAAPIGEDFLRVQDAYLRAATAEKGVTDYRDLPPVEPGLWLWRGDITTLRCSAIVNAANSGMTGCYQPCHGCIDNCIHTYAGVQLRLACDALMREQGHEEPTGSAKLTDAYNLPCDYVLHTVGPIVSGRLTEEHRAQLASCYRECLKLAAAHGIGSVAFCCISTGVFGFPQRPAAEIAVETVRAFRRETGRGIDVIFNVFKEEDYAIYREILGAA